jgi:hypothetical protein
VLSTFCMPRTSTCLDRYATPSYTGVQIARPSLSTSDAYSAHMQPHTQHQGVHIGPYWQTGTHPSILTAKVSNMEPHIYRHVTKHRQAHPCTARQTIHTARRCPYWPNAAKPESVRSHAGSHFRLNLTPPSCSAHGLRSRTPSS